MLTMTWAEVVTHRWDLLYRYLDYFEEDSQKDRGFFLVQAGIPTLRKLMSAMV